MKTGKFDKNGKEVCVGDKVSFKNTDNMGCEFFYTSVVEQDKDGEFITPTRDGTGSYYLKEIFEEDELEII